MALSGRGGAEPTAPRPGFRPEIEGLRAVAALLVACYHIWSGRVSGGVDVFFVVSGYLVTHSLLGQAERDAKLDLVGFWKRLFRRLAPAGFFVLFAVTLGCILLLPRTLWLDTAREVLASAFYVENWLLALNAVDYLARDTLQSPVQHYWALSIQGQFYVFWPLALAAGLAAGRALKIEWRRLLIAVTLAAFAASLAYSIYITAKDQPWAYFDSFARFWEFGFGALLALAAIISCGMVIRAAENFPGLAALWPTTAAAAILLVGSSGGRFGVHRLLGSKPFVAIGAISYHIYLWHWVILIFVMRIRFATEAVNEGILILAGALALSFLTVRLIETPVRRGQMFSDGKVMAAAAAVLALCASFYVWTAAADGDMHARLAEADPRLYPGATAMLPGFSGDVPDDVPIIPQPVQARRDREYPENCLAPVKKGFAFACRSGVDRPTRIIAIAGASHATHYAPTLARLVQERGWVVVDYSIPGCRWRVGGEKGSCVGTSERVTREILALKPDLVVTTSKRADVPSDWAAMWQKVLDQGIPILAIRDNPSFEFNVPLCVEHYGAHSTECSVLRAEQFAGKFQEAPFQKEDGRVRFLDLTDYFCDAERCPAVIGNILVYRDEDHLTATFARTLAPMVGAGIDAVFDGR